MSAQSRLVNALLSKVKNNVSIDNYVVSNVAANAARDINDQVSILVGTQVLPVPYLEAYQPPHVAGDVVMVLTVFGSPIILGRPIGLPTF